MQFRKRILLTLAAALAFSTATLTNLQSAERFDHEVRNDFFAGFSGDSAALDRAMKKTEAVLAAEPQHAEALVWHGSGLFFLSGQYFREGNQAKGMDFYSRGIGMMQQAVQLAPKNIGVRIPRGAILLSASRRMPPPMAAQLRADALSDYLAAYELQKDMLGQLGTHPRGELLLGIADAYSRQGDLAKAEEFFQLLQKSLPASSPYARSAAQWLSTREPLPPAQAGCFGCHTGK